MTPALTQAIRRLGFAAVFGILTAAAPGLTGLSGAEAGQARIAPVINVADAWHGRSASDRSRLVRRETRQNLRRDIRREARREFRRENRREARREIRREIRRDIYRDRAARRGAYVYVPTPRIRTVTPRYLRAPRYAIGATLPRQRFLRVLSPQRLGLATPRRGYAWYTGQGDAYLIALGTGLIVKALAV
ncbi:MAG: RcnB family protein [Pseudomonadota bacterium]